MSAFAAIICRGGPVPEELLARIAAPLAPLGPHGGGPWRGDRVALGHRLLATRSGASLGPHVGAGGVRLAGDIRLDARDALCDALRAAGTAPPPMDDDDALVLAAYATWDDAMLSRLAGDFAFALWDPARRRLLLGRDPFGARPLYYAETARGFVASTALGAVRSHPDVAGDLDEASIVSFLRWGWVVDVGATSFAAVRRLQPGHLMVVDGEGRAAAPRRWWDFPEPPPLRLRTDAEYLEAMRETAGLAMRDRLRLPVAAILMSGGVDSTGLAAAACRSVPTVTLTAFTVDSSALAPDDDPRFARLAAGALGISHVVVAEDPIPLAHVGDPGMATPEPVDNPEWLEWRHLAARIATAAPVVVIGEDGDNLFQPPSVLRMAQRWGSIETAWRLATFVATRRRKPHFGLFVRNRLKEWWSPSSDGPPSWVRADVIVRTGPQNLPVPESHPSRPEVHRALSMPVWQRLLELSSPEYAGVPLDTIWPLLDQRVLRFALSLPPLPWCQQKEVWRRAWRGMLPHAVLDRPKTAQRGVIEAQVARWRAATPAPQTLDPRVAEFVDTALLRRMLKEGSAADASTAWRVLQLDHWLRSRC